MGWPNGEPELLVVDDPEAVAEESAGRVVAILRDALASRDVAHLALTGGSTAVGLYRRLASPPMRRSLDWGRVHLWWGDERYVPRDHAESNARLGLDILLGLAAHATATGTGGGGTDVAAELLPGIEIPPEHVHPFPTDDAIAERHGPEWAAAEYDRALRELVPAVGGVPAFDLVLLGVGPDGHVLSVFPDSPVLAADAPLVLAVPAPEHVGPHLPRLTLHPRVLAAAGRIIVMVTGEGKAEAVAAVFGNERDAARRPAQLARRSNATWLVDRAAARFLHREAASPGPAS